MVNQVEIIGGQLNGSVLQNAATEATLLRILQAMQRQGGGSGANTRLQNLYNQSLTRSTNTLTRSNNLNTAYNNTLQQVNSNLSIFNRALSTASNLLGNVFGLAITTASSGLRILSDYLTTSYENFLQLSQIGSNFGNNMLEASRFALQSGMGLREFTNLVRQGSDVLTALGGSATQGARRLAQLRDSLVDGEVSERLYGLGMTTTELEGYLVDYLAQQQRLGTVSNRSNQELIEGTRLYAEELDRVSRLTGADRRRLQDQARRQAVDPVINAMMQGLSDAERARGTANLAMIGEVQEGLDRAIQEIAAGVPTSALARELLRTGNVTRDSALDIVRGNRDAGQALQDIRRSMEGFSEYNNTAILQANEQIREGANVRNRLRMFDVADLRRRDEEARNRDALSTAFGRISQALRSTFNRILGTFVNSGFFRAIETNLGRFAQFFLDNIDPLRNYFGLLFKDLERIFQQQGLGAAIRAGFTRIFNDVRELGLLTEISNFFRDLFGITNRESIWQGISRHISDFFRGLFGIERNADLGTEINNMIGNFFRDTFFPSLWSSITTGLSQLDTSTLIVGGLAAIFLLIFGGQGILFASIAAALVGLTPIVINAISNLFNSIADRMREARNRANQQARETLEITQATPGGAPGQAAARGFYRQQMTVDEIARIQDLLESGPRDETESARRQRETFDAEFRRAERNVTGGQGLQLSPELRQYLLERGMRFQTSPVEPVNPPTPTLPVAPEEPPTPQSPTPPTQPVTPTSEDQITREQTRIAQQAADQAARETLRQSQITQNVTQEGITTPNSLYIQELSRELTRMRETMERTEQINRLNNEVLTSILRAQRGDSNPLSR
jgi:hypothetical protein